MWQPIATAPRDGTHILAYPALLDMACVVSWAGTAQSGYWRLPMTEHATPYFPEYWTPVPQPGIETRLLRTKNPLPSGVSDPSGRKPKTDGKQP